MILCVRPQTKEIQTCVEFTQQMLNNIYNEDINMYIHNHTHAAQYIAVQLYIASQQKVRGSPPSHHQDPPPITYIYRPENTNASSTENTDALTIIRKLMHPDPSLRT